MYRWCGGSVKTYQILNHANVSNAGASDYTDESKLFLAMWDEKRKGRAFPAWRDFDWLEMPMRVVPTLMLVDVVDGGEDFRYRFFGTYHSRAHKVDMTKKLVADFSDSDYREAILGAYRAVMDARAPTMEHLQIRLQHLEYTVEILRLPLADDGAVIDKILVCETLMKGG